MTYFRTAGSCWVLKGSVSVVGTLSEITARYNYKCVECVVRAASVYMLSQGKNQSNWWQRLKNPSGAVLLLVFYVALIAAVCCSLDPL